MPVPELHRRSKDDVLKILKIFLKLEPHQSILVHFYTKISRTLISTLTCLENDGGSGKIMIIKVPVCLVLVVVLRVHCTALHITSFNCLELFTGVKEA